MIDSQGSGLTKDLAGVQRSRVLNLFTVYYSYFSALFNRTAESWAEARRAQWTPGAIAKLAGDHLLLYSLPAVMTVLIRGALTGGGDDKKEDQPGLAAKVLKEHIGAIMGNFVLLRDLGGAVTDSYGYRGPAGAMGFDAVSKLIIQAKQGDLDAGLVEAAAKAGGLWFKLPVVQAVRTLEGLGWMTKEKSVDLRRLLFGKPKP